MSERFDDVSDQLVGLAFGLGEAIVVFVVAWFILRLLMGPVSRRLDRTAMPDTGKVIVENGVALTVYLIAMTMLLALWGATWTAVLTAISAGTIAVALGLQDILRSIVAGIFILVERPFMVGDQIKVRDVEGRVESIGLRRTTIRADSGELISVPNGLIFTDPVSNRSPYRTVRTVVAVSGVSGAPADLKTAVAAALQEAPGLEADPEITVRSHRSKVKAARLPNLPGIDLRGRTLVKPAVAKGTQVRVEWVGSGQPAVRDEVVRRLKALFPEGQVRVPRR
ncbi:MAG: mechanosensitive ion channel family protein [Thermomicrobiales bacterium]